MRHLVLALAVYSLLAGCASMSEDQCRSADWYAKGLSDGRAGEPPGRIDAHREACAQAGVIPDGARWAAGWREGVRSYCTPRNAWQRGADNRSYEGACRDFDEPTFLRWYGAGKDVYKTRQERDHARREIDKLEEQLKKTDKDDERRQLREQIRRLDAEHARLRRLVTTLESAAPR